MVVVWPYDCSDKLCVRYLLVVSWFYLVCALCRVVLELVDLLFFFFKQKTAYEMRISDWSSDVCSSDLEAPDVHFQRFQLHALLVGDVLQIQRAEVRLAGHRAQAREFRDAHANAEITLRRRIRKGFQCFAGLADRKSVV